MASAGAAPSQDRVYVGTLRFKQRNPNFKTILSIDGGGLRGLVPAAMCEGVEDAIKWAARKHKLVGLNSADEEVPVSEDDNKDFDVVLADYFDVLAGTSTGSILATYVSSKGSNAVHLQQSPDFQRELDEATKVKAAVAGTAHPSVSRGPPGSAAAAQALFLSQAPSIFPKRSFFNKIQAFFGPKYPAIYGNGQLGIEAVLRNAFGGNDVLMTSVSADGTPVLKTSLVTTSYQMDYDRPFLMYYSRPEGMENGRGTSGYGALRRTLTKDQEKMAKLKDRGASDLVRVEQDFRLWQTVRASTAAPTFFPTADVDNLGKIDKKIAKYQMTDGGVVANNPSMAAMLFAASKYDTAFVGQDGKPSLAVLSFGCGGTSELSHVKKDAGPIDWVVVGPLVDIISTGAGELNAALNQQLAREWPGRKKFQMLRLQLTAGLDAEGDETVSFSKDVITLPRNGNNTDPHAEPFVRALYSKEQNTRLSVNKVLSSIDAVDQRWQLLGLGYAVACDEHVKERLRIWVSSFVLDVPNVP